MTDARLAGSHVEALSDGTPAARLAGSHVEVLTDRLLRPVLTGLHVEVLTSASQRRGWGVLRS